MIGHVDDLKHHSILDDAGYCYFMVKVNQPKGPKQKMEDFTTGYFSYWKLVKAFTQLSFLCLKKGMSIQLNFFDARPINLYR